jgi:hypothetical protein
LKKKIILISILLLLITSSFFIHNKYNLKYKDNIYLAVLVNGTESSSIPAKGNYSVSVTCNNATGSWDYDNWKAIIKNINGTAKCSLSFKSSTRANLASKIIGLAGKTQGNGQVVNETFSSSSFTPTTTFTSSNYANTTNDATYPFTWDSTNSNWTSTNKTNSTTSTITFNPSTSGYAQVCYTISSEANYDKATFYVDNVSKGVVSGSSTSCIYLGGYRYEGFNPNNYISFNGELWRIIGVFDSASHGVASTNLVKIIRNDSIGGLAWDKTNTNDWPNSSLSHLLNDYYYNGTNESTITYCYGYSTSLKANCDFTTSGITNTTYRNMIQNVTWYLGGMASATTASTVYTAERGTTVYTGRSTSSVGNIGLMYASDYGYASLASSCARTTNVSSYSSSGCAGSNWLYGQGYEWIIVPSSSNADLVWYLNSYGSVGHSGANIGYVARPTLYLKSDVMTYAGDGSKTNPYVIVE